MFKAVTLIGIIGILIIAYMGLVIPIQATTGFQVQIPLVPLDLPSSSNNGVSLSISNESGNGEQRVPGVTIIGISSLDCTVFELEEPLEIEIADDTTAFNILRLFMPVCSEAEVGGCIDSGTTAEEAMDSGVFSTGDITIASGTSIQGWIIGNSWSLDQEGNLYRCIAYEQAGELEEAQLIAEDQPLEENTVIIDKLNLDGPGFVVIHADDDGSIGEVIGFSSLLEGFQTTIGIEIDGEKAGEKVFAMLYYDDGDGEFTAEDVPVTVNEEVLVALIEFL